MLREEVDSVDPEGDPDFALGMELAFDVLIGAANRFEKGEELSNSNCQKVGSPCNKICANALVRFSAVISSCMRACNSCVKGIDDGHMNRLYMEDLIVDQHLFPSVQKHETWMNTECGISRGRKFFLQHMFRDYTACDRCWLFLVVQNTGWGPATGALQTNVNCFWGLLHKTEIEGPKRNSNHTTLNSIEQLYIVDEEKAACGPQ